MVKVWFPNFYMRLMNGEMFALCILAENLSYRHEMHLALAHIVSVICGCCVVRTGVQPVQATFRIPPRMTKTEVKEYLTKVYDVPVEKVTTANYLGTLVRGETVVVPATFLIYALQESGSDFGAPRGSSPTNSERTNEQ